MTLDLTLAHISDLVHTELAKFFPDAFVICGVTSELLPNPYGDDYIRTTVVLEDGHPQLDARALNKFSLHIYPLCTERGLDQPTITYANKGEIPS